MWGLKTAWTLTVRDLKVFHFYDRRREKSDCITIRILKTDRSEKLSIQYIMGIASDTLGPGESVAKMLAKAPMARFFSTVVIRSKKADLNDNRMLIVSRGLVDKA